MVQYVIEHGVEILAIVATVVILAGQVAKLTPNKKDDDLVAKVADLLGKYLPKADAKV